MRRDKKVVKHYTERFGWQYVGKRVMIVPATPAIEASHALHMCSPLNKIALDMNFADMRWGELILRENEDGPLYWCNRCGKSFQGAFGMFLRLAVEDRLRSHTAGVR
jgi:hypothetical protein